MSDTFTVKIEGLKELERKMISLGPEISKKALRGALVAGAVVIREEAKRIAPVNTGRLRRAMYIKRMPKTNPLAEQVIFGVRHGRKMIKRNLDAYYWSFLEFGTKFIKRGEFIQNSFKHKRNEALRRFKDVLAKKISTLVKGKV